MSPQLAVLEKFGQTYSNWFYKGELNSLWPCFSVDLQQHFGSLNGFKIFHQNIAGQIGRPVKMLKERIIPWLDSSLYNHEAIFSDVSNPVYLQYTLDETGTVLGLLIDYEAASQPSNRFLEYQTKTPLRLPFLDTWFVYWGGDTLLDNYHVVARDQRFAYDFVIAYNYRTYTRNGQYNEDYFCFGHSILAPGNGMVMEVVNAIPDNDPGHSNEEQPLGNYLILDHENGEYSFLAHLQQYSINVKPGNLVKAGDIMGACGNSGRSGEPHLHCHLQTTPYLSNGEGLPSQFLDYQADRKTILRGSPVRGQAVTGL